MGLNVTAWVNNVLCGQGATRLVNGQIVYTLNVQPDAPGGKAGCGAPGQIVTFKVNGQTMNTQIAWDINRVHHLPLSAGFAVYLPLVRR